MSVHLLYFLFILIVLKLSFATVLLNEATAGVHSCRGTMANITCTTTTVNGFLSWQDSQGMRFDFTNAIIGDSGSLGSTKMVLIQNKAVSDAVVYTSIASKENITEDSFIECFDGAMELSINVQVKNPSSPSWAYSACNFSHGYVHLFWNTPSVAPECCDQYIVSNSTEFFESNGTSATMTIGKEAFNATAYCVDHLGDMVTKTDNLTININFDITQVRIEPLTSCDTNITYQISWATNSSAQNVCTPPITKTIVTCASNSSNNHTSDNYNRCSVPANDTINVNIIIVNAAGFIASKFASSDVLARACRVLQTPTPLPSETAPNQLPQSGIAALIILGLLVLILAAICAALMGYIVIHISTRQHKINKE